MNYVIRKVTTDGVVSIVAGNTQPATHEQEGCPPPCMMGVVGSRDGTLREARFYSPYDVAIGPNGTVCTA